MPTPAAGAARRAGKHHLSRHHRRSAAADPGRIGPERGRRTSSSPTVPSARIPATATSPPAISPKWSAAWTQAAAIWPWRFTSRSSMASCRCPARRSPRRARSWRTPIARQHRPGQRAEGRFLHDGHRRLGGDRGGEDEAVRLPGLLSRPGPGRALHPDRPVLPDVGGSAARRPHALHRAGRRGQHRHAASTSSIASRRP